MSAARAARLEPAHAPSTLGRYREIATVLVRHGLADVVDALHLGRYLAVGIRILPRRARIDPALSRWARLRLTFEELGPTFVKFGQMLSTRADLLPPELVAELARLQDRVAPLPPGEAEAVVEAAFGRPLTALFRRFEAVPIASASIAQVHRAELSTGEAVAVKVRRPGIGRVIAADLEVLRQFARLLDRHLPAARAVDPVGLVEEFARTIRAEQDLAREGRNINRFARQFGHDPTVRVPRVYGEQTTVSVLTLEYLEGVRLADLGIAGLGPFARKRVARRGANAVLAQILVHGFFHADPHPGNVLVLPDQVVAFVDFGIVGHVDEPLRRQLTQVIRAVWRRDAAALATLATEITRPLDEVNVAALTDDLAWLLDAYADVPLRELPMIEVLADVVRTAARHHLRIPSNLMLLIKAVTTIEAVGRSLDPDFRIVRHAAPLAERVLRAESSPAAMAARAAHSLEELASAVHAVPLHLDAIGRRAREGRLQVQFVHQNLEHLVAEMDRSSNRIAFALIIAAIVIGSSIVMEVGGATVYGVSILGLVGFFTAGILGVGLAIAIVRSGRL